MLAELKVKSLGIIEELTWAPGSGLNIITGETGAGKSLVIDAISSLIDGELDEASIRHGAELARLEGVFFVSPGESSSLAQLLSDKGVSIDEDTLALSAEFRRHGRGVFRLNGNAVPRVSLREAGHWLVNIHSQSEHLSLFESKNHLEYLDAYGHTTPPRERFRALFLELSGIQGELSALDKNQADRAHREDILTYQIDEITKADLKDDEEQELTRERQIMGASEKLKSLSYEACQALDGDDGSAGAALSCLHQAREALRHLAAIDPTLKASLSMMEEAYLTIEELNRDIKVYQEKLDYDPDRLEEIDARLELVRSLKKKYGGNIGAIKEYLARAKMEMAAISSSDEKRALLEDQSSCLKVRMGKVADELSVQRNRAAKKLSAAVKKELAELSLKQVVFEIHLSRRQDSSGIPLREGFYAFCRTGADDVEFLVSTNPGEPLKPLEAIASTGELSRFTLALKVALAEADKTPVLVFDEIDIGIGGRSGEMVGQKLWRLARHHQVICVTHLPQIAAYGDKHYRVEKDKLGERTVSRLYEVAGDTRLKELTDMIGGASQGEAASRTAAELIKNAAAWVAQQSP